MRGREAELVDDAQAVGRGDRLEDVEPVLLVVAAGTEAPVGRARPDAGQVAVELGGEEAGPAHLAVADDVDAGPLLVADREVDAVVEHLREIGRAELAALGGVDPGHEPRRPRVRADHARQQAARAVGRADRSGRAGRSAGRGSIGAANANARAGLSTNRPLLDGVVDALRPASRGEPVEQPGEAGRSAVRRA